MIEAAFNPPMIEIAELKLFSTIQCRATFTSFSKRRSLNFGVSPLKINICDHATIELLWVVNKTMLGAFSSLIPLSFIHCLPINSRGCSRRKQADSYTHNCRAISLCFIFARVSGASRLIFGALE